jgi:hypothetical protein
LLLLFCIVWLAEEYNQNAPYISIIGRGWTIISDLPRRSTNSHTAAEYMAVLVLLFHSFCGWQEYDQHVKEDDIQVFYQAEVKIPTHQ